MLQKLNIVFIGYRFGVYLTFTLGTVGLRGGFLGLF